MIFLDQDAWEVGKSKIKGRGIFAKKDLAKGIVVGDYIGTVLRTKDFDINQDKNFYLTYYHDQASIYPDLTKVGIHLLNHSCSPNCFFYTYKGHTLVFTLRKVFKGEEMTVSYLLPPKDKFEKKCTHQCRCGSKNCTKSMHLPIDVYKKWWEFQEQVKEKRARITYGKTLKLLSKYPVKIADHPIYELFLKKTT